MQSKPVTGTYTLDGLIEGPLGGAPDTQARLTDWVQLAKRAGYHFSLEIDGSGFGLLGDNAPRTAASPTTDIAEPLRDLLQQLAQSFPLEVRAALFSTVRSVQYGDNLETQTLYALGPDGTVDAQQRTIDAVTIKPPEPLTRKDRIRAILTSLVILAALAGISSLFIDWGDMFTKTWRKVAPLDVESIAIEPGGFEPYLEVAAKDTKGKFLLLEFKRTAAFPLTVAAVEERLAGDKLDLGARKTLEALASGYVRIELFAADEVFLGTALVRVAGLRKAESVKAKLPFRREDPPTRIRLGW